MTFRGPASWEMLDLLCPMHAVLDETGHVLHLGPTLQKVFRDNRAMGRKFLDLVELRRPRLVTDMAALRACHGLRLRLRLRAEPRTLLKALLVALPEGESELTGGASAIVNCSFGISILDAVRDFAFTSADFAVTDLAIEMLYLVEAKSAAMAELHRLNDRIQGARIVAEQQAFSDGLTGLKNRRALEKALERLMQSEQDFALLHLDLDFFKTVNDTHGHAAGDHVLREVALRMTSEVRESDLVARVGGDEFILILAGVTDRERLAEFACRLIARLEDPIFFEGSACHVSASIGATLSSAYKLPDPSRMTQDADLALYAAKERGRRCHVIFDMTMAGWVPIRDAG